MSPVRRAISLIFALGLSILGLGGIVYILFFTERFLGLWLLSHIMMAAIGLFWLWEDLFKPAPRPEA